MFIGLREKGMEGESKGEKHRCERETSIGDSCIHLRQLNPQPRHVPWLGIKPVTLQFTGLCSNEARHTNQGYMVIFNVWVFLKLLNKSCKWIIHHNDNIRESDFDYIFTNTSEIYTFMCFYSIN